MFESEGVAALRGLQGKLLQVPDLRPIYANWASGLNPYCEELRAFIDEKIDIYVKNEKAREKTRAIDLGWFASLCYPTAGIEQLKTMALISMAFFIFDDTIDKEIDDEAPDFASDFDAATKLRQDSIAYMRHKLFQGQDKSVLCPQVLHPPQEFASFEEFAPRVTAAKPGQVDLDRLADDIQEFIDTNALEQTYRLSGSLPSTEEYWTYRHGVGAVFPYSETGRSLDSIVHELVEQMYSSARKFDVAAASLRAKGLKYDEKVQENIIMFIRAFETFQTGCFKFFMDSKRFGVKAYKQDDGSYLIPL
ncbi:hypothetical protein ABKA04_009453 [Annulohypoxylon sp. FPYF3050]